MNGIADNYRITYKVRKKTMHEEYLGRTNTVTMTQHLSPSVM